MDDRGTTTQLATDECPGYLFPAMAKKATKDQGLANGRRFLQVKALWEAIERAFEQYPRETLAHSFCHHQQIAFALATQSLNAKAAIKS